MGGECSFPFKDIDKDINVEEFFGLFKEFGPLVGLVLFFVWRDWKREDILMQRVNQLEDYQKDTLVKLVESTTNVIAQNTAIISSILKKND
jgi:hypothetical protein